jgi:uridine kinase
MNGYKIVSEAIQRDICVLLTGVGGAGKTTISNKLSKKLKLKGVVELDDEMRQLVKKKHPDLKGFYKEQLIEYFGDYASAKKEMWKYQLPGFKKALFKYRYKPVLMEGMIIYMNNASHLIDSFNGEIYVISPTSPEEFVRKTVKYAKRDNYPISKERQKEIAIVYKGEVKDLQKFIDKYKDKITLIDN